MSILPFSPEYAAQVKEFVLSVLSEEGFDYDPLKDYDLDDIKCNYLSEGAFFLYLRDGTVAGTSAVKHIDREVCEIKRLYVDKKFRGQGIGFALFFKALDFASENYSLVKLKTDKSLKKAISIYLQCGFVKVKEEKGTVYFEKTFE